VDFGTGSRLLDYRLDAEIGRGGMSVVYLAEDLRLRRKVAIKIVAPELAEDERFRERFVRESELVASIDHPNVIPIYEAGEVDARLYIAMRYVAGTDLKALLRRDGALEPIRAVAIVAQLAAALDVAHGRGLVHRDVKPANVLLTAEDGGEHVYLCDFGVAKSASLATGLTTAGERLGTIDYIAPEQIRGAAVDGRADQYSLGCLLFECLTGEVPFRRDTEAAVIYAHLRDPPNPVGGRGGVPRSLDAVLARALAKRPRDRYATCGEFALAAQRALGARDGPFGGARTRTRALRLPIAASAAFLIILGAVGDGASSGRKGELPPSAPLRLLGKFVTRIGPDQPNLQGTWVMEWRRDGVTWAAHDGATVVVGTGRDLPGRRYEFSSEAGPEKCGFGAETAVYRWKLEGRRLSLTPVHDECGPRRTVLTHGPLTKLG
jgi:protein kinase-like protein